MVVPLHFLRQFICTLQYIQRAHRIQISPVALWRYVTRQECRPVVNIIIFCEKRKYIIDEQVLFVRLICGAPTYLSSSDAASSCASFTCFFSRLISELSFVICSWCSALIASVSAWADLRICCALLTDLQGSNDAVLCPSWDTLNLTSCVGILDKEHISAVVNAQSCHQKFLQLTVYGCPA